MGYTNDARKAADQRQERRGASHKLDISQSDCYDPMHRQAHDMKRRDAWPATCTLWIGDTYAPHLAATAELLAGATTWHVAEDVDAAIVLLETADVVPTLIVVAERYVGHVAHAQLDRLAGLAPLAGFVALTSIWSEGSGRSGNPWPAARMIGWARAEAYIQEQLRASQRVVRPTGRCRRPRRPTSGICSLGQPVAITRSLRKRRLTGALRLLSSPAIAKCRAGLPPASVPKALSAWPAHWIVEPRSRVRRQPWSTGPTFVARTLVE
ncbi:MAG: hypothetical protein R3C10_17680 [Pirellulales bacterium]